MRVPRTLNLRHRITKGFTRDGTAIWGKFSLLALAGLSMWQSSWSWAQCALTVKIKNMVLRKGNLRHAVRLVL